MVPKDGGKIGASRKWGRGRHGEGTPRRTILANKMCTCLPIVRGEVHLGQGKLGIIVDGELAHPAVPYPKYVAVGICKGFCLGAGH